MSNRTPRPVYDPEYVRDVSEAVYRDRLGADGVERAEDDPKRGAAWLRRIILEISRERERQMTEEGWTPEHDDTHDRGKMALGAATYAWAACEKAQAFYGTANDWHDSVIWFRLWPWAREWWKPGPPRRMLIKAAALIVAEIERLDRVGAKED